MIRTRRFEIVGPELKGLTMKVAFASTDKVHVDEHFGRAEAFYIYEVGPEEAEFTGVLQVKTEGDDEADRIEARCAGLDTCALVYVAQIGGPAAARLVQKKIHPIKSKEQEPITDVVAKLQEVLRGSPPPWLRKAMLKNERPGFLDR
ncbi:nitrogen fixation protein NifX [Desulfuromonas sp.]|uniref:nitrogen fixation protein NifX n=1 Tax=Desulfuromonas sp. TaxID=892 RepID=UPI0025BB8935|nr:nitrogen fixation protein NifX [Desulfuromonas sp.]